MCVCFTTASAQTPSKWLHPEKLIFAFSDSINTLMQSPDNQQLVNECSVSVYLRHNMYTHRQGPIVRYIPGMLQLERGTHNYLTEAQLQIQVRPPGEMDCKVVAFHTNAKYLRPQRFSSMGRFSFQIYHSKLFIDQLLNPFNRRNRRFYRYELDSLIQATDSTPTTLRVHIRSRFSNDQLGYGYAHVDATTGAILEFQIKFRHHLRWITVGAQIGKDGYERMVPVSMRIVSDLDFFGNRVYEITDVIPHHTFSCPLPQKPAKKKQRLDLTKQCILRIDTTSIITNPQYFEPIRPKNLGEVKLNNLQEYKDLAQETSPSLETSQTVQLTKTKKNSELKKQTQELLLSSHTFNMGDKGYASLHLPAVITPSMVQWGKTKGLSLKARIKFNLNPHRGEGSENLFEFNPSIGYSFKQKQIYWQLPILLRFAPKVNGLFAFEAGGGSHNYNNKQAEDLKKKWETIEKFDSLQRLIDNYGFHDYVDTYVQADLRLSLTPGFHLTLGPRFHSRTLVEWNKMAEQNGLIKRFTTIGPHLQLQWTPAQYYYRQQKRRIPLYSRYPTFTLSYERGYNTHKGDTHYERLEGSINYRLPLYAMRTLYFRASAGLYPQRGNDCFLDYDFFRFNYMPQGWNDEFTGELQVLSSRWYNESRYYALLTSTYESPMLIFSRLPIISRLIQKERIYLNLLSVQKLHLYTELGYSLSTHIVDFGVFAGISHDHSVTLGCKAVLRFFDN